MVARHFRDSDPSRQFTRLRRGSTPIPKDHLTQILEAANYAPTPRNRQAWKFLVIYKNFNPVFSFTHVTIIFSDPN
jgi:nitroreductase